MKNLLVIKTLLLAGALAFTGWRGTAWTGALLMAFVALAGARPPSAPRPHAPARPGGLSPQQAMMMRQRGY